MHHHYTDVREEMRASLRAIGLRATSPRLAVLLALHERAAPMSHEEVTDALRPDPLDRATLYRILADLSEAGLLRRMDLGDHVWRYELLDDCRRVADDHAHFLCTDCGQVTCLPELEIRTVDGRPLPPELRGAELHLKVTGRCGGCAGARQP